MFGDNVTADQILTCDNAIEAKCLGYHIAGFDMKKWINDGYSLCYDGIHANVMTDNVMSDSHLGENIN